MRSRVSWIGLTACLLLAMGGCARLVTAPAAEPEVGALAAYTVTNGDDSGAGSLRQVVADASADGIVTFDPSVTTVALTTAPITIDKNLSIVGPADGTVTISGSDMTGVFVVASGGVQATLENLTITHGYAEFGAGVRFAWRGDTLSSLTIRDCTVSNNRLWSMKEGAGLYVDGILRMERTTVRDNVADVGRGGGIYFSGEYGGSSTIVNSTFVGNVAQQGGAIYTDRGVLKIAFSTITGNWTQDVFDYGGGLASHEASYAETSLLGTIVVGNRTDPASSRLDLYEPTGTAPFVSLGYNLIGYGSSFFVATGTDVTGLADVGLLAIADNGGPTQTVGLAVGSAAIDKVPPTSCVDASGAALTVDQRGMARPQSANCDIGAFEVAAADGLVVTTSADDGPGSLRQIVLDAPAGAAITFAPSVSEVVLTSGPLVLDRDVTIAGPADGTVTLRGDDTFPIVRAQTSDIDVVLRNLTIRDGYDTTGGGGVRFLWPDYGFESGTAPAPSLRLERCTVVDNSAGYGGGGLYVEGDLILDATTVVGNLASGGIGGGVYYVGTDVDSGGTFTSTATILNSTITGNGAGNAAGLYIHNGDASVYFSTITANVATYKGGGVYSWNDPYTQTTIKGTIVVGNTGAGVADDVYGESTEHRFVSLGYNVIGTGTGTVDLGLEFTATGDLSMLTVAETGLLPLAANGGPTYTHALATTSVVLDRVPAAACSDPSGAALARDQRGVARPQGSGCDPGAVELEGGGTALYLAVSVDPDLSGSVTGGGSYEPGATATLTATPAEHWQFDHWSGDATGTDNPVTVTMDTHKTVVANFAPVLYSVTETLDGGGSVLRDPAGTAYPYGTTVKLTAVPTDEWGFSYWSGAVTGPFSPAYLMVTGPMSYTAHFIRWYTLTVDTVGSGTVGVFPDVDAFPNGNPATLTATADPGWRFDGWSGDYIGIDNPVTITMDADKVVTATFVPDTFTVTTHTEGTGTVEGGGPYTSGAIAILTAVPGTDARFDHWSGDASGSDNPISLPVTGDLDVTAHFVTAYGVSVTIVGDGEVTLDPADGPYADGTIVSLTATPAPGSYFQMWTGALDGEANPASIEVHESLAVTAVFRPVVGPMVRIALDGDGHVTSEPAGIACGLPDGACTASFPKNTRVTLHGIAHDGAAFLGWTGSVTDVVPDLTIRLNADKAEEAHFVPVNGPVVAIEPTGSARGSTAIVRGSLVCATGPHDLEVSIFQAVEVKGMTQFLMASTTLPSVACGQSWTATLSVDYGRFARDVADVTVTIGDVVTKATVQLR